MFPVSAAWKTAVKSTNRVWAAKLSIETAFETFELDDADIVQGTLRVNEGVTEGSAFSIGYAYKDDLSLSLINSDGRFDDVQLNSSVIRPSIGLEVSPGVFEWVPLGVFVADTVNHQNAKVEMQAFNVMCRFEKSFSKVPVTFPCSALVLISTVCMYCGVTLATTDFLHKNYVIAARPGGEMSCRDIVASIAELAAGWAHCNRYGQLEIGWFDNPAPIQEAVIDGNDASVTVDGGDFSLWSNKSFDGGVFVQADPVAAYTPDNRYDFRVDDAPVVITGVTFEKDDTILVAGSDRYAVRITNNPLIQDNAADVILAIWERLKNFTFLPFTSNWQGDPAIQAGDMIAQTDRKGNTYRTIVTQTTFVYRGKSVLFAGGKSEAAAGYVDPIIKNVSQLRAKIQNKQVQIDALKIASKNAFMLLSGVWGGYVIDGDDLGGDHQGRIYLSDNADVTQAQKIWVYSLGGIGYFPNGLTNEPGTAWTNDGQIVASLVTASMIRTGLLQSLNGESWIDLDNGAFSLGDGALKWDAVNGFEAISAKRISTQGSPVYAEIGVVGDALGFRMMDEYANPWFGVYKTASGFGLYSNGIKFMEAGTNEIRLKKNEKDIFVSQGPSVSIWSQGTSLAGMLINADGVSFWAGGSSYGITATTPIGQRPVFKNGLCVGFST